MLFRKKLCLVVLDFILYVSNFLIKNFVKQALTTIFILDNNIYTAKKAQKVFVYFNYYKAL